MNENQLIQEVIAEVYRWTLAKLRHEAAMTPDTAMDFSESNGNLRAALAAWAGSRADL